MIWLAAMSPALFWILALLAAAAAGVGAYYGVQSLRQGLLLKDVVGPHQLRSKVGQTVAVSGRAERQGESTDPLRAGALWIRTTHQEYRRSYGNRNRRGRWQTISKDENGYPFVLHVGQEQLAVRNQPTEVHGAERRTGYQGPEGLGGLLSNLFSSSGQTRTIVETLYEGDVTVVGELSCNAADGSLTLRKHDGVGMLLTSYSGGTQAAQELVKGVVGVLLPVAWLAGVIAYFPH